MRKNEAPTAPARDQSLVAELILKGDLRSLKADDKIRYYNGYCERLGLDPFTKPFDLLTLNGREILYCTRSGAQQLNKLHSVSHAISSREIIEAAGVYQVTARATLPDGRYTESIGAVNVGNLKGEAYANAIMKAETKAKRRATLDLLGLGVLDESELDAIKPAAEPIAAQPVAHRVSIKPEAEKAQEAEIIEEMSDIDRMLKKVDSEEDLLILLDMIETLPQIRTLYALNRNLIDGHQNILSQFKNKKNELTQSIA